MSKNFIAKIESLIPQLTVDELIVLNRKIIERIKFMQKAKAMTVMQKFSVGDQVSFKHGDDIIRGKIVKFNQKTVSIITDSRVQWNVAPGLLTRADRD